MSASAAATNAIGWRVSTTDPGSPDWATPPAIRPGLVGDERGRAQLLMPFLPKVP